MSTARAEPSRSHARSPPDPAWTGPAATTPRRNATDSRSSRSSAAANTPVAGLGIDCRMCHVSVEDSAKAGLPPTYTCMTCHSQVWTNADLLAPVRQSLADDTPIAWGRVNNLPDYVDFNHSIHVAKGVGCESCHAPVDRKPLTYKARSLTMQFCLECHRNPGPNLRPENTIYDTEWQRGPGTPAPDALLAHYGIPNRNLTECSICHR